jgi:Holliday junction resolvase RusA-like endonuclease
MIFVTSFRVYGTPKAQPRSRRSASGGVYNPGTADEWKMLVAMAFKAEYHGKIVTEPVSVTATFYFKTPKKLIKSVEFTDVPHTSKPDIDNVLKSTLDALTDIGAWADDSQVFSVTAHKWYGEECNKPGAFISIYKIIE